MSGVSPGRKGQKGQGGFPRGWPWLALLLPMASCVPAGAVQRPLLDMSAEAPAPQPYASVAAIAEAPAFAANPLLPGADGQTPPAPSYVFQARTPLDQLRSLDCLAQAVYYEARSESEEGRRAVAQVVINRVRHPAWPNSVCGVVYQGPMRAGGGCQFTFTCDGSLALRPAGFAWDEARRIAAEALAGRTFAPVGLSTHYHTNAVFPSWAPRLARTATIGAHEFYRLPGLLGAPGAFAARYAGTEPVPRPAAFLPFRRPMPIDVASLTLASGNVRNAVTVPSDIPQDPRWSTSNLPDSTVRDEFRQSGQWRADAPAAVTGAR
jgi:hypothetical protein